jgi:hypothetical protein
MIAIVIELNWFAFLVNSVKRKCRVAIRVLSFDLSYPVLNRKSNGNDLSI